MGRLRLDEQETAQQRRAFEDYWALGHGRSVRTLVAEYRRRRGEGESVPSARERTLEDWCSAFNWRARCAQREAEEAAERRARTRERVDKFRDRMLRAIEIDASAYAQRVFSAVGPDGTLGEPVIIGNAGSLDKAVKLFFQLAESPLSTKPAAAGSDDPGLADEYGFDISAFDDNPEAQEAAFALMSALYGGTRDRRSADPGGPGEGPESELEVDFTSSPELTALAEEAIRSMAEGGCSATASGDCEGGSPGGAAEGH